MALMSFDASAGQKPEYKSKLSGYEFGVGVPLITPLTGYNVFVGYVNKDASSFLGKRFGFRADFTIPSNLKMTGTVSGRTDGQDGYLVDAHGKVMGFNVKLSDFSDEKIEVDAFEDDRDQPIVLGEDAADLSLEIKNKNMGLLVDFYPFGNTWFLGGLRFSGGYYLGDFDISAMAHINQNIDYNYRVDINKTGGAYDVLHAQIARGSSIGADFRWKYHGPYAGVGFDLGIWRGFKFYMDAGVVFAHAPKVTNDNVKDRNLHLKGRYEIYDSDGNPYSSGSEMVELLPNGAASAPVVDDIVRDTVGMVVRDTLDHYSADPAYTPVINSFVNQINTTANPLCPGGSCTLAWDDVKANFSQMGNDIVDFLNDDTYNESTHTGDNTAPWISTLISGSGTDLSETIAAVKEEWETNVSGATSGIQHDIDQAWDDYNKNKNDAIKDINDFLDDYGMMPMVKLGFMYRF